MKSKHERVTLEYFKSLRSEINLRIRNQSYYTISKVVACGALLGHLADRDDWSVLSVPVVAVLLDFVIHHNLAMINALGGYLRDEIETKIFADLMPHKWQPWETKAQSSARRDLLDRFGQAGVTIAFLVLAIFLPGKPLRTLPPVPASVIAVLVVVDLVIAASAIRSRSKPRPLISDL